MTASPASTGGWCRCKTRSVSSCGWPHFSGIPSSGAAANTISSATARFAPSPDQGGLLSQKRARPFSGVCPFARFRGADTIYDATVMPSARQVLRLLLFAAFAHGLFAAENRISRPVDPGRRITLRRHTSQWAQPRYDRGPAAASTSVPYLTLRLKPAAGLEELLIRQRTPASPDYHRWLTPDEFGDRFGLSTADMAKLTAWLRSEGLHVHDVARGRHWITFSGTVDQLNRAFRAQIHRYLVNGELHIANSLDPSIPEAFADVVSGIDGLDDFGLQPLLELEQSPGASAVPQFTAGSSRYLAPDDFATIYDLTPLYNSGIDGSGQKIAVIGRSAVNLADVRQF